MEGGGRSLHVFAARWYPPFQACLTLGKVSCCPFDYDNLQALQREVVGRLVARGIHVRREHGGSDDFLVDCWFLDLLISAAKDPEISFEDFKGVRVCPGVRLLGQAALYPKKKRWKLPQQGDPMGSLEAAEDGDSLQ